MAALNKSVHQPLDTDNLPTATAIMSRLRFFQPTRRPVYSRLDFETSWGRAIIEGKLGQQHVDILEVVMRQNLGAKVFDGDARLRVLIDPYCLRKALGGIGQDKVWEWLKDMQKAIFDVSLNGERYSFSIIDEIRQTESRIEGRDPRTKALRLKDSDDDGLGRRHWMITFSQRWTKVLDADIKRFYDPMPIVLLRHGVSQAIARLLLSHQTKSEAQGGWTVDSLIGAVCGDISSVNLRHRRHELIKDVAGFLNLGFVIKDARIFRVG